MYRPRKAGGWGALPHLTLSIKLLENVNCISPAHVHSVLKYQVCTTSSITPHNPPARVARGPDTTPRTPSLLCSGAARSQPLPLPLCLQVGHQSPSAQRGHAAPPPRPAAREAVNSQRTVHGARWCTVHAVHHRPHTPLLTRHHARHNYCSTAAAG
jgi:hypothetical protein